MPPPGSAIGTDLYVASDPDSDFVVRVSPGGVVTPFAVLDPEADITDLTFPPPGSAFGDSLYVSANNLDGGQPSDCGGKIQRLDPGGAVSDLTTVTGCVGCGQAGVGLGEPGGITFAPAGPFGGDLYVANSSDEPTDVARVTTSGSITEFVDDGNCSFTATGGLAPIDVAFGPGVDGWGSDLYFTDFGDACSCIRTASSSGNWTAPFVVLRAQPVFVEFGKGGAFGRSLYVAADTSLYRVEPDGSFTVFATGFSGAVRLTFDGTGDILYAADRVDGVVYRITAQATEAPGTPPRSGAGWSVFPNPFRLSTTIRYAVQVGTAPSPLGVYDVNGRLIRRLTTGRAGGDSGRRSGTAGIAAEPGRQPACTWCARRARGGREGK